MSYTLDRTGQPDDFDFLHGHWQVDNRCLATRTPGSNDWKEFPAVMACEPRLGGIANVDQIDFTTQGWSGLTMRLFDTAKRQWSIYWISSRTGTLYPPVHGGFSGDRGEFYGEDEDGGRHVYARFVWLRQGPDAARWEQAFSPDGVEWEINWTMQMTRVRA